MTDADELVDLDEATVERIAAGEVVERPASVVKELVENSLDAGASRVEVTVERGGKDLVRVRDDGEGMTEAAVRRAVRSHTTSKIRDAADLDAGVDTLGFRGEALATIAAVSRLVVRTKPPGADAGTELRMAGGDVAAVERTGCPAGTTVEVTDLFYNTPAREKYLKQDRTEFDRVNDVATKYALARPDVAVSLTHDGREVFAAPGTGDRRAAILAVYGREVASAMVPVGDGVDGEDGGDAEGDDDSAPVDGPLDGVEGYVSHPETTRSSRDYVAAFVNGRYVQSDVAREAVVDAYGGQLAADRYPFAVLDLHVPPGEVDVNVHPRKMEVRFADEAAVRGQVEAAVRAALLSEGLVRSSAPRGRSAPDETPVAPARPGDEGASAEATGRDDGAGTGATDAGELPSTGDATPDTGRHPEPRESSADGPRSEEEGAEPAAGDIADPVTDDNAVPAGDRDRTDSAASDARRFDATAQRTLDGEAATGEREYGSLPPLRVLGQHGDTYVVASSPEGLVLVDQHAADERVHYERLRERFGGDAPAQSLAEPVAVDLTAAEAAAFDACEAALERLGFAAERTGDRTVEVTAVPAAVAESAGPEVLRDVVADVVAAERDAAATVEALADELLADMACHPAVTGNTSLTEGSVVELLAALDDCENPWACPHGRPTVVRVDDEEIDERFERDYPGH